jgi:dihydrofolate reductase
MGKLIVLISPTPDGFAESQHVIIDPEFFDFTHSLMSISEVALFGRATFELFQDRWSARLQDETSPPVVKKIAQSLHDMQKIVFSSTLSTTTWHNSEVVNTLEIDRIRSLKENTDGAIITFGSLSVVETLIEMNLVDDYYFNIQPLLAGYGNARFFSKKHLSQPRQLSYVGHKHLASGAHIIHYQPSKA